MKIYTKNGSFSPLIQIYTGHNLHVQSGDAAVNFKIGFSLSPSQFGSVEQRLSPRSENTSFTIYSSSNIIGLHFQHCQQCMFVYSILCNGVILNQGQIMHLNYKLRTF